MRPRNFLHHCSATRVVTTLLLAMMCLASPVGSPSAWAGDDFDEDESFAAGERYYSQGARYVRFKGYSKAFTLFKKALPFMNEESDIYYNLVSVAEALGKHEEIYLYASAFLRIEPDGKDAREIRYKLMKAESTLKASRRAPAQVRFDVDPPGTPLYVNDIPVGVSGGPPVAMPAGTFTVKGKIENYHPFERTFKVNPRSPITVSGAFEKIKYYGELDVRAFEAPCAWPCSALVAAVELDDKKDAGLQEAKGVRVYVNGTRVGKTPMDKMKMLSDRYLVRFERDGWDDWSRYINVGRNETFVLHPILERSSLDGRKSK